MPSKRSYGDRCGVARALDLVGERWALLVVRELLLGPKRFTDLRAGLPNLGPDVLSQRLRDLEAIGVVRRAKLPPPASSQVYELTAWGQELEPVVLGLGAWGSRAPFPDGDARLGVDSAVLALKTLFDPASAGSIDEEFELRLGPERFRARVANGALAVARGGAEDPLAVICGSRVTAVPRGASSRCSPPRLPPRRPKWQLRRARNVRDATTERRSNAGAGATIRPHSAWRNRVCASQRHRRSALDRHDRPRPRRGTAPCAASSRAPGTGHPWRSVPAPSCSPRAASRPTRNCARATAAPNWDVANVGTPTTPVGAARATPPRPTRPPPRRPPACRRAR
jgi:DNA-binding HxlR family transcriptional regulator